MKVFLFLKFSSYIPASFLLCTFLSKWNVPHAYVEVQAMLFRLFVLGCIHLLSSWSWSVILFVPDPLPASTIQTHKGGPWRGAWEEKQHIWVWLKPSKLSLRQPDLFLWFILYNTDVQHMEKDILYFLQHVLFVFLWTLRFTEPPQKWSVSFQQLPDDL